MRESFKQERAPCMNQAKMFLLQLIHDTMEVLAKLETKSVFLYNFNVAHISFTGQTCEPKEASKQLCGTINEAFGTFHLSEITFKQEKVISPNFGVFTLR